MKCIRSEIIGWGHYLPKKVLTNDDLSKMVDTNDEWISTRTGIKSRHISEGETTADMSIKAELAMRNLTVSTVRKAVISVFVMPAIPAHSVMLVLTEKLWVRTDCVILI